MYDVPTWQTVIAWALLTISVWVGLIKFIIYCIKHG